MRSRLTLILGTAFLIAGFQNCGRSGESAGSDVQNSSQIVIGSTSHYKKIVYDPHLEYFYDDGANIRLEIDLVGGNLTFTTAHAGTQCAADSERLVELRSLLAMSSVCVPGPLPAGTAVCMAIGLADVELSDDATSVQLRPVVCHSGTFLCDGNDERLRSLITDFKVNPPASCSTL